MVEAVGDFRNSLEEQLAEVELLQAMFPGENELEIEEGGVEEMNAWLRGDTHASLLPSLLNDSLSSTENDELFAAASSSNASLLGA